MSPFAAPSPPGLDLQVCDLLLAEHRLTGRQIDQARGDSIRWGTSIGDTLAAAGAISARHWADAMARVTGLPLADLLAEPPDAALLHPEDRRDYLALGAIPWKRDEKGHLLLAATRPDQAEALGAWAARRFPGAEARLAVTAKFDILWSVQRAFDGLQQAEAEQALPVEGSAQRVLSTGQAWLGGLLLAALAGLALAGLLSPAVAILLLAAAYLVPIASWLPLAWIGGHRRATLAFAGGKAEAMRDAELPVFTILVPIHREMAILPVLAEGIRQLDYPRAKLDVKLVMEADDAETIEAAKALRAEAIFEIVRVPPPAGQPRTRARACNYALRFARGEFLAVFDAQSIPARDQLRQVLRAFQRGPAHLACVQSRQNYWNPDEAMLTRLAALEAAQWSDLLLPGMTRLGLPVPLHGATCHFRTAAVTALGGWDAHNIAGDTDLALRMLGEGHGLTAVQSTTLEEACRGSATWLRQRSRGLHSLMQTSLVQGRRPLALWRGLGGAGLLGCALLLAGPVVSALALLPLLALALAGLAGGLSAYPAWLAWLPLGTLLVGAAVQAYAMLLGALRRQDFGLAPWVVLVPARMVLEGIAAWLALWQLPRPARRIARTPHGTSTRLDAILLALRTGQVIR